MNLGDIYIKAAAVILVGGCVLAGLIALIPRCAKRTSWGVSIGVFLLLAPLLSVGGCYFGHRPLFVAWHRWQNTILPRTGCLTYDPTFFRLYASYRMTRAEFDAWVTTHPWRLTPFNESGIMAHDGEHLGFKQPEASYATDPAPNGRQLRVYYENGTMYVSYWVM